MAKSDKPYKAQAKLDILFGEDELPNKPSTLKLDSIVLPQQQPRRYFDPEKLEQLTESIKAHGLLENLLVRPLKEQEYELVAGERRYRAAIAAGLLDVPVKILELTDDEALQISLVENLQREDLNPVEETEAILQLLSSRLALSLPEVSSLLYQMQNLRTGKITNNVISKSQTETVEAVFTSLGLMSWESFISNRLSLLKLPASILEVLRQGLIEYTKAKAIATVKETEPRNVLLQEAIERNLTLSEIKERIKLLSSQRVPDISPKGQIQSLARRLNQTKLWEKDKKRWLKIQKWLTQIETLLSEVELEPNVTEINQLESNDVSLSESKQEISKATLTPIFENILEIEEENDGESRVTFDEIEPTEHRGKLDKLEEENHSLLQEQNSENVLKTEFEEQNFFQREEIALTDQELAERLGCNSSTCYRWRTGTSKPRGTFAKILQEWEVRGEYWYRKEPPFVEDFLVVDLGTPR